MYYNYDTRSNEIKYCMPMEDNYCPKLYVNTIGGGKVKQVVEKHQVPESLAILSFLGTASLLLQGLVDVKKPKGQIVPTSLYVVGIAESGERKSTIFEEFSRSIESELRETEENKIAHLKYEQELEIWVAFRKNLIRKIAKAKLNENLEIDEDLCFIKILDRHELSKPDKPPSIGLGIFSDTTPEGLAHSFHEDNIKSAGIMTSEGEEFFVNGIKRKNSLINSAWSGDAKHRNRVVSGKQKLTTRLSMCLLVQPDVAYNAFYSKNSMLKSSGAMARMLWTYPKSTIGTRFTRDERSIGTPISDSERCAEQEEHLSDKRDLDYQERVVQLVRENEKAFKDENYERSVLSLSPKAESAWILIANVIEHHSSQGHIFGNHRDHASKLADQIIRVAANIHFFEWGNEGEISEETLYLSIRLCLYLSKEYRSLFHCPSEEEVDLLKIENWLEGKRNSGFRYILKRNILMYGPLKKADRLNNVLSKLRNQGRINLCSWNNFTAAGRKTKPIEVVSLFNERWDEQMVLQTIHDG